MSGQDQPVAAAPVIIHASFGAKHNRTHGQSCDICHCLKIILDPIMRKVDAETSLQKTLHYPLSRFTPLDRVTS